MRTRVTFTAIIESVNEVDYSVIASEVELSIKQVAGVEEVDVGIGEDE